MPNFALFDPLWNYGSSRSLKRQVWFIRITDERGCAGKTVKFVDTGAIPERIRGVFTMRCYTNPRLLYLCPSAWKPTKKSAKLLTTQPHIVLKLGALAHYAKRKRSEEIELSFANKVRYLGIFIEAASSFKCHWIMPSGPSIVLLILFSGDLAEWHQTRLLYNSC